MFTCGIDDQPLTSAATTAGRRSATARVPARSEVLGSAVAGCRGRSSERCGVLLDVGRHDAPAGAAPGHAVERDTELTRAPPRRRRDEHAIAGRGRDRRGGSRRRLRGRGAADGGERAGRRRPGGEVGGRDAAARRGRRRSGIRRADARDRGLDRDDVARRRDEPDHAVGVRLDLDIGLVRLHDRDRLTRTHARAVLDEPARDAPVLHRDGESREQQIAHAAPRARLRSTAATMPSVVG